MQNKRQTVQQEALKLALQYNRCGLGISMGVGKTLIGLQYIQQLVKQHTELYKLRVLLVAPKLAVETTWLDEAVKHNIDISGAELVFTTYLSLVKHAYERYDVIIFDECHSLLYSHLPVITDFKGRILGLTGTPPRYHNSEKGEMVDRACPIRYSYITDEAVEDNIINDYKIIVHMMSLSQVSNIPVYSKNNSRVFYSSEQKDYDYWTKRIDDAKSKKEEQIASIMRMKALMRFTTKEHYAKYLLNEIDDKCIVFCNTQDQADRICAHSVHSDNEDSDINLSDFKADKFDRLSCVLQLNEGINIPNLRAGIILHAYGNERKSSQRIGRLLRLNPDDLAIVHVLGYKDTVDEKWIKEALKDFDKEKIKYFNV